jgi:heat shock protein HslJ
MSRWRVILLAAAVATAILLAACRLPFATNVELDGSWRLTDGIHGGEPIPVVAQAPITMTIDGSEIGGHAACNIYGGTIEVDGDTVSIEALSMTEMACEEGVMASEASFMSALPLVDAANRSGDRLTFTGPDVELHFTLAPS